MTEKPNFESAEQKYVMSPECIKSESDIVELAQDPFAYLAKRIDLLSEAEDQPGDVEMAKELLCNIEDDLNILRVAKNVIISDVLKPVLDESNSSEIATKFIFKLFKDVGFSLETMLSVILIDSHSPFTQVNNKSFEKCLREVYRDE